jgi:elongation factor 1-gamma
VGNAITLADITLASALVYPFKITCCPEFRAPFPNVMRWFNTVSNQPQFLEVAGKGTCRRLATMMSV